MHSSAARARDGSGDAAGASLFAIAARPERRSDVGAGRGRADAGSNPRRIGKREDSHALISPIASGSTRSFRARAARGGRGDDRGNGGGTGRHGVSRRLRSGPQRQDQDHRQCPVRPGRQVSHREPSGGRVSAADQGARLQERSEERREPHRRPERRLRFRPAEGDGALERHLHVAGHEASAGGERQGPAVHSLHGVPRLRVRAWPRWCATRTAGATA